MDQKKVKIAIIGAGSRGLFSYGNWLKLNSQKAEIVAVAEPRRHFRRKASDYFKISKSNAFKSFDEFISNPKVADAVIIATTDSMHEEQAIKSAEKGYDILLEKPMATTPQGCIKIVESAKKNGVLLAVCHVMRYTPIYVKMKEILDSDCLGDICTIQSFEGVGWWHYAHSYVRGNWRNSHESSFMLLTKSCHDIDLLNWWIGKKCLKVSSFGYLKHFKKSNKPEDTAQRCIDCRMRDGECPYSAYKYYFDRLKEHSWGWPLSVVTQDFSEEGLSNALETTDYGLCVYNSDNDVVDHQIVNLEFENQITASLTMTAFTPHGRSVKVMCTKGYMEGDEKTIRLFDFSTQLWKTVEINRLAADITGGHAGGDYGLMESFINSLHSKSKNLVKTGPEITLRSHLVVFAAEESRIKGKTISIDDFYRKQQHYNTN